MKNFFRKDLNLKSKWRHRLLTIFCVGIYIFYTINLIIEIKFNSGRETTHQIQATVNERIENEVKLVKQLAKEGEKIDGKAYGAPFILLGEIGKDKYKTTSKTQRKYEENLANNTYCAINLYKKIEQVIDKTQIQLLYIKEINNYLEPVSIQTASKYMKKNNINCITKDGFGDSISFLNPGRVAQEVQENFSFYKSTISSILITLLQTIETILVAASIVTIPILALIIIYYKIIIYVAYGNPQKQ